MSNNVDNDVSKVQPRCKQNIVSVTKGLSLLRDPQLSKVCLFIFIHWLIFMWTLLVCVWQSSTIVVWMHQSLKSWS